MPADGMYLFVIAEGSAEPSVFYCCEDSALAPRLLALLRAKFPGDCVKFAERAASASGDLWVLWDQKLGDMENDYQYALVEMIEIADNPYHRFSIERQLDDGYPPGDPHRYMRAAIGLEAPLGPPATTILDDPWPVTESAPDLSGLDVDQDRWVRSDEAAHLSGLCADTILKRAKRESWPTLKRQAPDRRKMNFYPLSKLKAAWPDKRFQPDTSGNKRT